jgi:hypothetical protein
MSFFLHCHAETPAKYTQCIEVFLEAKGNNKYWLRYHVEFEEDHFFAIPGETLSKRTHGLWKTTCFELFVKNASNSDYLEYNFSPSSQWAAYHFDRYREGMSDYGCTAPVIGLDASASHFALEADVEIAFNFDGIGLSAIIEEADGTQSFWALNHPPGKPDFHHPDCFVLSLTADTNI